MTNFNLTQKISALENHPTTIEFQSWLIIIDVLCIVCYVAAIMFALVFLYLIIYDKLYHTVAMLLVTNSCIAELVFAIDLLGMAVLALHNDMRQINYYDSFCISLAYFAYMSLGVQNYSYLLQAIYRYFLIVHPNRLFYQSFKFNSLLISIAWLCCIIYPLILAIKGQFKYLVYDQICQMPLELSFITIFNTLYIYYVPILSIIIIYFKIVRYVHEMSKHVNTANRLFHAKRELKMIRRIVSLVSILVGLGFPYAIFIIMSFFNSAPKYHFRIAYIFISTSLFLVMIGLMEITEPLKNSLMKRIKCRHPEILPSVT